MKKTFVLMLAALTALVSCNKEIIDTPADNTPATPITFQLTASHPEGEGTKAVKSAWEAGDVIFVFFQEFAAPKYLKLSYDGTKWIDTQMNGTEEEALGLSNGQELHMRAVYLPFGSGLSVSADGGKFVFSETQLSYYLTATLTCTVVNETLRGNFDMKVPDGYVQFFVDNPDAGVEKAELREPHLTPQGVASVAADGLIVHKTLSHGAPLPGYVYDKENKQDGEEKGFLFSGILAPEVRNAQVDYHFTFVLKNQQNDWAQYRYYSKSYTNKTLYRGPREGRALKLHDISGSSWTEITDYKPIDLGCDVPTGVGEEMRRIYWSSRNLGASADFPAGNTDAARWAAYGDYYAWAATETYYEEGTIRNNPPTWKTGKTGYNWASYPHMQDGESDWPFITKYTYSDNQSSKGVIWYREDQFVGDKGDGVEHRTLADYGYEDDVARIFLGKVWHIPTYEEWKAMLNERFTWVWDDTGKGHKITSNILGYDGDNGPFIFLPAAGFCEGENGARGWGYNSDYWSSSLFTDNTNGRGNSSYVWYIDAQPGRPMLRENTRYGGRSVRPVTE